MPVASPLLIRFQRVMSAWLTTPGMHQPRCSHLADTGEGPTLSMMDVALTKDSREATQNNDEY